MITPITYQPALQVSVTPMSDTNGLSQVFAAAVVNRQFCELLLQDPHDALQKGYLGESFSLSNVEHDLIVSIQAKSLPDLARQLNRALRSQY